jgi:hypothetical protein
MIRTLTIILVFCCSIHCLAQDTTRRTNTEFYPVIRKWYCVKLNPASLYFGKASFFGEYTPRRRYRYGGLTAFTFGLGIPLSLENRYTINKNERTLKMKTFSAMAGYRVYITDGTGLFAGEVSGLYLEPYLKYVSNSTTGSFNTNLATSATAASEVSFSSASKYSGTGIGIQLGFQFHIRGRFLIDAFIIGPEINSMKTNIALQDLTSQSAWNSYQSEDARNVFDDFNKLPILRGKLVTSADDGKRTISGSYKGLLPGFRIGISIGYSFRHEKRV